MASPCSSKKPIKLNLDKNLRLNKTAVIPPEHEVLIQVPVGQSTDSGTTQDLEPVVEDSRGISIARRVVKGDSEVVPVRIAN